MTSNWPNTERAVLGHRAQFLRLFSAMRALISVNLASLRVTSLMKIRPDLSFANDHEIRAASETTNRRAVAGVSSGAIWWRAFSGKRSASKRAEVCVWLVKSNCKFGRASCSLVPSSSNIRLSPTLAPCNQMSVPGGRGIRSRARRSFRRAHIFFTGIDPALQQETRRTRPRTRTGSTDRAEDRVSCGLYLGNRRSRFHVRCATQSFGTQSDLIETVLQFLADGFGVLASRCVDWFTKDNCPARKRKGDDETIPG